MWSGESQKSFEMIKSIVWNSAILQYPDFKEEFIPTTDASDYALGAWASRFVN